MSPQIVVRLRGKPRIQDVQVLSRAQEASWVTWSAASHPEKIGATLNVQIRQGRACMTAQDSATTHSPRRWSRPEQPTNRNGRKAHPTKRAT